jgi:hypothetical protein
MWLSFGEDHRWRDGLDTLLMYISNIRMHAQIWKFIFRNPIILNKCALLYNDNTIVIKLKSDNVSWWDWTSRIRINIFNYIDSFWNYRCWCIWKKLRRFLEYEWRILSLWDLDKAFNGCSNDRINHIVCCGQYERNF